MFAIFDVEFNMFVARIAFNIEASFFIMMQMCLLYTQNMLNVPQTDCNDLMNHMMGVSSKHIGKPYRLKMLLVMKLDLKQA